MAAHEKFDLVKTPLKGTNLIEASAGTGKTYTIAGLFLRLIVEKRIPVERILVVTFTEAATEELKERIRNRLREAMEAFLGKEANDPLLESLVTGFGEDPDVLEFITESLRSFDQSAIFTIHGFCRRMLVENAFESGSLFDTELVTEQEELKREVVDDFWRMKFYTASPLFTDYCLKEEITPDSLLSFLSGGSLKYGIKIIPEISVRETEKEERDFREALERCALVWKEGKGAVSNILLDDPGLNRRSYGLKKIPLWIEAMDDYLVDPGNIFMMPEGFDKFTREVMAKAIKKNHTAPDHLFFDACQGVMEAHDALVAAYENNLLALKIELTAFVTQELALRNNEKSVMSFDDLLLNLHKALKGEGGEFLAESIRNKYEVALIDEFQDTDPVQYEIFRRVFAHKSRCLFMIGDPKQAIYGFRGADIFAYMEAASRVDSSYTLFENYRSEAGMVNAVNTLFQNRQRPFLFDRIGFLPARAAMVEERPRLEISGEKPSPLVLWQLRGGEKEVTKKEALARISHAVAGEISRILNLSQAGLATLGGKPVREKHIAVLVRKNAEAQVIKDALSRQGIFSVIYSTGNIFDSAEAMEMERILGAIADPSGEGRIRASLATDIFGMSGENIADLEKDNRRWEDILVRFRGYHDIWNRSGFIQMFNAFITGENVLVRLMGFEDGERRCTNLLHLGQLLHSMDSEKRPGMDNLVRWLKIQIDPRSPRLEEYQLRLETDAEAVEIVTIHKSKGMEYPIVFCPFSWSSPGRNMKKEYYIFHDDESNHDLTLDAGSDHFEKNREKAFREELAEDLRLLYVALTRSKNRCYMAWGPIKGAGSTGAAYLFNEEEKKIDNDIIYEDLKEIEAKSDGAITLVEMPEPEDVAYVSEPANERNLVLREFKGNIDNEFRISSFTSLAFSKGHPADGADRDMLSEKKLLIETGRPQGIFAFPRGAKAGTFLHDVFEHLDFTKRGEELEALVLEKLNQYGFDERWSDTICLMVENTLTFPLNSSDPDFSFSLLAESHRLNEMEFHVPMQHLTPERLEALFLRHDTPLPEMAASPEALRRRFRFSPVKGFLKGYIDMVFRRTDSGVDKYYIVDWKSNHLGNTIDDYTPEVLGRVMKKELYDLQYHLYTVALHKYLTARLGENYSYGDNFGGIYYVFLRGVGYSDDEPCGIFRDKPSQDLVEELANLFDF